VTYLSRTARLGIAAETQTASYVAPAFTVPFTPGATRYADVITQLHDRTVRATDTDEQAIAQGHYVTDWTVAGSCYPDWAGWLYRAIVGPDQFTPGTVTTLALPSAPGAKAVWLDAAVPYGAVLQVGAGDSTEYAQAGIATGSGPFLVSVTQPSAGLRFAHPAGDPAQTPATHLFQQDRPLTSAWPTYSLSSNDGPETLGWPGCTLGSARLRIPADGYATLASTWKGWPPAAAAEFAEDQSDAQPMAGWAWTVTDAGGASTRGTALDLSLTRTLNPVLCCNAYQGPLIIATGPMRAEASYTAIFDSAADLDLYRQAIQQPAVFTLAQPAAQGGCSIAVTLSVSGWTAGAVSLRETYVTADFRLSGIANTADSPHTGTASVVVRNYVQQPYGP
jgi:hypothetical protein